jgi:hypothetical protein
MTSRHLWLTLRRQQQRSQDQSHQKSLLQIIRQSDTTLTKDYHTWILSSAQTSIRSPKEKKTMRPTNRLPARYHHLTTGFNDTSKGGFSQRENTLFRSIHLLVSAAFSTSKFHTSLASMTRISAYARLKHKHQFGLDYHATPRYPLTFSQCNFVGLTRKDD